MEIAKLVCDTFIAILQYTAWPIALLCSVTILKEPLFGLLNKIKYLKGWGMEASLYEEVGKKVFQASKLIEENPESGQTKGSKSERFDAHVENKENVLYQSCQPQDEQKGETAEALDLILAQNFLRAESIAQISPMAAIVIAWQSVEFIMDAFVRRDEGTYWLEAKNALKDSLDDKSKKLFKEAWDIRNMVVHGINTGATPASTKSAQDYVSICREITRVMFDHLKRQK